MRVLSSTLESTEIQDVISIEDDEDIREETSTDEVYSSSDDVSSVFGTASSISSVNSLLNCCSDVKKLSAQEEKVLVKRAQENDKKARNDLILANLKMVASLARRYKNRGLPTIDLMQEGILGMLNAVRKFDLEKGIRFSTYAAWWVREAMTRSLSNKSRTVRLPVHLNEFMTKLRRVRAELSLSLGRKPTDEEIALELGVKLEKVRKSLRYCRPVVSLDQPISNTEGEDATLIDLTSDEDQPVPDEEADCEFIKNQVNDLLESLSKREREVVRTRFGLDNGQQRSLTEVSNILGLTRDQVGKASCKAMRKLKVKATQEGLQTVIA